MAGTEESQTNALLATIVLDDYGNDDGNNCDDEK
jgi:hypothetical protein